MFWVPSVVWLPARLGTNRTQHACRATTADAKISMGFNPNRQMLRHAHFYNKGGGLNRSTQHFNL
jgi:hypothetical protein